MTVAALAAELATVVRKGLPVTERTAHNILPNLRSVYARSIQPALLSSRIDALNELIPRLVDRIEDVSVAQAARCLLGVAPGTRRTSLIARQRQAADELGYNVDHFRQRVQADVVRALAEVLERDLRRYASRVKRASESLEPTGDSPSLTDDDLTHEEELVSRIWQHVYGLRAELIAHLRLLDQHGYEGQAEDHRQAAMREREELQTVIREYTETYGEKLIRHGEAEFAVEGLERLIGWHA